MLVGTRPAGGPQPRGEGRLVDQAGDAGRERHLVVGRDEQRLAVVARDVPVAGDVGRDDRHVRGHGLEQHDAERLPAARRQHRHVGSGQQPRQLLRVGASGQLEARGHVGWSCRPQPLERGRHRPFAEHPHAHVRPLTRQTQEGADGDVRTLAMLQAAEEHDHWSMRRVVRVITSLRRRASGAGSRGEARHVDAVRHDL